MKVTPIAITMPLLPELKTAEDLLVYIARVSNPTNQLNTKTGGGLLRYMLDKKHWSPFDMANLTVEVVTSKAVSIQILRHWSIKPQEFSQRYAEVVETEDIEIRKQATENRQSSDEEFDPIISVDYGNDIGDILCSDAFNDSINLSVNTYKAALAAGVAKECARMILPMCSSTTLYLNGSVRSWIHYFDQRTDMHAQKEHRTVAYEIRDIFRHHFPVVSEVLWPGYKFPLF